MYEVSITDTFSAAHSLRYYRGKCEKLHGHNWKVELTLQGRKLNKIGILYDFTDLKKILKEIISNLDHKHLNEIPAFKRTNPTSENIAKYIYDNVKHRISKAYDGVRYCDLHKPQISKPDTITLKISRVKVWESESSSATYKGN
jgi:6-pyruvoyltetrahydropterin/6-carboxytetrahydropterin synthase